MASMICPNCKTGLPDPPPDVCPSCWEDPRTVVMPAAQGTTPTPATPTSQPALGAPVHSPAGRPCATETCGGTAAPASDLCLTCQLMARPTGQSYVLGSTWGDLEIREGEHLTLGRSPESAPRTSAILTNADRVSRLHADLHNNAGTLTIVDNSTNGTAVNGHRLRPGESKTLLVGDRVVLGTQVEFVVRLSTE